MPTALRLYEAAEDVGFSSFKCNGLSCVVIADGAQ